MVGCRGDRRTSLRRPEEGARGLRAGAQAPGAGSLIMDPKVVLSKSAKGREEIETRKHKLEARTRQVLITVNGKLTAGELAAQFGPSVDVNGILDQLVRDGFAEPAGNPADRLKQVRAELAALVSASLGPAGDDIAMKIEAFKTLEEMRAYLESRRAMLDGALGKTKAAAFWAKANALMG